MLKISVASTQNVQRKRKIISVDFSIQRLDGTVQHQQIRTFWKVSQVSDWGFTMVIYDKNIYLEAT